MFLLLKTVAGQPVLINSDAIAFAEADDDTASCMLYLRDMDHFRGGENPEAKRYYIACSIPELYKKIERESNKI